VLGHFEAVKKEVAVDGISVKIDIDNAVIVPTRYVLFLMNNSSGTVVRNWQFKFGPEQEKQLTAILSVLCKPYRRLTPARVPLKRGCALVQSET